MSRLPAPDERGKWRDHDDRPVDVPAPPSTGSTAFYAAIGDFQGADYRRNAFASGTADEVAVLRRHLRLEDTDVVLDVGCGDGRHLRALVEFGVRGVGVDVSAGLLGAAETMRTHAPPPWFVRADARRLPIAPSSVDAAFSVCQGGFGTDPDGDAAIVRAMAAAVRAGGRVAFTAFHALFAVRHLVPGDAYDPIRGVHHHVADVRGDAGAQAFDLWTTCYTAGEAVALLDGAGCDVVDVIGVEPGRYGGDGVGLDDPELLVIGVRR